jgi:hypothetical protein
MIVAQTSNRDTIRRRIDLFYRAIPDRPSPRRIVATLGAGAGQGQGA